MKPIFSINKAQLVTIICLIILVILNANAGNPVFVVTGKVTNYDGTDAETGLKVKVSNETRGLMTETTVRKQKVGEYRVNLIDTENNIVAGIGDMFKREDEFILSFLLSLL
ncbi:hypothetical protein H8E77_25190 [bacterium]|nr:hypothetical protein [bacterium]